MQRIDKCGVELQQRLTSSAHDEPMRVRSLGPRGINRTSKLVGRSKVSAAQTVGADEVGIAEAAYRVCTVLLTPRPEIAAGEATEHRRHTSVRSFALQGIEDFLDCVSHGRSDYTPQFG